MQLKNMRVIIFILMLVLLLSTISNASSSFLNITMNREKMKVREIPILMNGKVIKSESPSFLYIDRTLVSARLIAENYGAKVGWDKPTETVSIHHEGNIIELKINSNKARVNGEYITLDNSSIPKLVNFGGNSAKTMVPLTFLADILGYQTDWDDVQKAAYLKKKVVEEVKEPSKPVEDNLETEDNKVEKPVITKPNNGINTVSKIDIEKINGKDNIVIKGNKNVKYNILKLTNPSRLVIDLMDSELYGTDYIEKTLNIGNINGFRASQFVPDQNYNPNDKIVRVVFDIINAYSSDDVIVTEQGSNIIITPGIVGNKNNIYYNENNKMISLQANKSTNFNVAYDDNERTLTIVGQKEDIDLPNGKIDVLNEIISDFEVNTNESLMTIAVHFRKPINYNITSGYSTDKLEIQINKSRDLEKHEYRIVIDPGHGGNQPGASSASGIVEKNVALSVSLKLNEKLKQMGYSKVYMTRDNDKTLGLSDRTKFANELYADLFISIHANSVGKGSSVTGIEVLYAPKTDNYAKGNPQTDLAKFIQEELIKSTGAVDRKIKKRPNLVVLRDSKMPAVLIETGFLSNPGEAARINDSSYQDKMVDAIVKGVERYLNAHQ